MNDKLVEDKDKNWYAVYLDRVREYLKSNKKRLLTEKEEAIITAHLQVVAATYCNNPREYGGKSATNALGITQVLSIETAQKVAELHDDFPILTEAEVNQRTEEILAVQNYIFSFFNLFTIICRV